MSAWNPQILTILRDAAACNGNPLVLEHLRNPVVGQRVLWIFLLDELPDLSLDDQQRRFISHRPIHGFGKEITQFEDALCRVRILVRHSAAHR